MQEYPRLLYAYIHPDLTRHQALSGWFSHTKEGVRTACSLTSVLEFCENSVKSRIKRHVTLYNII